MYIKHATFNYAFNFHGYSALKLLFNCIVNCVALYLTLIALSNSFKSQQHEERVTYNC